MRNLQITEYTYTSELKKHQQRSDERETEYMARVDPITPFIDFDNEEVCETKYINGSSFGREILHFKKSVNFNPWTVLEKYPAEIGNHEIYLMYGTGLDFKLTGSKLHVSMAVYDDTFTTE